MNDSDKLEQSEAVRQAKFDRALRFAWVASWTGVALLFLSAALIFSCIRWYYRLEDMLIALVPMLLGTYLMVYGSKYALEAQKSGSKEDPAAKLIEALDLIQKVSDSLNQTLGNEAAAETKIAYGRMAEILNRFLSR